MPVKSDRKCKFTGERVNQYTKDSNICVASWTTFWAGGGGETAGMFQGKILAVFFCLFVFGGGGG